VSDSRQQSRTFEEVASLYDEARPVYPESLIDDVLDFAAPGPAGRILEIGCGTGKATLAFARRGHAMLCLEPGGPMAAIARRHCADHPAVHIVESTFEEWPLEEAGFELAISAQAFHWVDPAFGYPKLAASLVDGGVAALFWNRPLTGSSPLRADIERAYDRHAPRMVKRNAPGAPGGSFPAAGYLDGIPELEPPEVRGHAWSACYGPDDYVKLMSTQSEHRLLDASVRDALLDEIAAAIVRHGGELSVDYEAWLFMARRRPRP